MHAADRGDASKLMRMLAPQRQHARSRRDDGELAERRGEIADGDDGIDAVGRDQARGTGAVRLGDMLAPDEIARST